VADVYIYLIVMIHRAVISRRVRNWSPSQILETVEENDFPGRIRCPRDGSPLALAASGSYSSQLMVAILMSDST